MEQTFFLHFELGNYKMNPMTKLPGFSLLALLVGASPMMAQLSSYDDFQRAKKISVYLPDYKVYGGFYPRQLVTSGSASKIDTVILSFGDIRADANGNPVCATEDEFADYQYNFTRQYSVDGTDDSFAPGALRGYVHQLQELKTLYPKIKILISLGGYSPGTGGFTAAVASPTMMRNLVASCVGGYINGNFNQTTGSTQIAPFNSALPTQAALAGTAASINPVSGIFDGFDIDWEFPIAAQKASYTAFLTEFRNQLKAAGAANGKRYLLSAYLPAGEQNFQNIDLPGVGAVIDYANLQSYDFNGPYDQHTGFNGPLYQSEYDSSNFNIDFTITSYISGGFPARKILLGIPFYAYGWTVTGAEQSGQNGRFAASVNASGTASAPPTPNPMYVTVQQGNPLLPPPSVVYTTSPEDYTLFSDILPFSQVFRDSRADVPYLWDGTNFWSYDDQESIRTKMKYARAKSLGGSFVFEITGDLPDGGLLKSIYNGLNPPSPFDQ